MLLQLFFPTVVAFARRRTARICLVKVKRVLDQQPSNYTFVDTEVTCYNSFCCSDGCCAWYINFAFVIFVILCFFLVWKVIDKCWHKYCRDMADTTLRNESQENMLMVSSSRLNSGVSSRDGLPNYGSNTSPEPPFSAEDKPPSYEEAIALGSDNR